MAKQIKAKAIIAFTHSGYTACRLASFRPYAEIFAFTNDPKMVNKLSLVWGIRPFYLKTHERLIDAYDESIKILKEQNLVKEGDSIVHVGIIPIHLQGKTNMIKVTQL